MGDYRHPLGQSATFENDLPNGQPRRARWTKQRQQQELFDTEELSGLRSAELSRELREIQKATPEPFRKEKRRTSAVSEARLGAGFSRAGELSEARKRGT